MTSGKVVDVETNLQKQMCGGGVVRAVGGTLLSHHGRGLSFLHFFFFFLPFLGLLLRHMDIPRLGVELEL